MWPTRNDPDTNHPGDLCEQTSSADASPEPVTTENPSALYLSRQGQALENAVLANLGSAERHVSTAESKPESDRDMVVWLHQRMTHLQHERESRWQKILKLLPGLS